MIEADKIIYNYIFKRTYFLKIKIINEYQIKNNAYNIRV